MCRSSIRPLCRRVTIKYKNGAERRRGWGWRADDCAYWLCPGFNLCHISRVEKEKENMLNTTQQKSNTLSLLERGRKRGDSRHGEREEGLIWTVYGLSTEGVCVCEDICLCVSGLDTHPGGSCSKQSGRKAVCFSSNTHYWSEPHVR